MPLQLGDKVFALRDSEIIEVEFIKYSKRGTSAFFKKVSEGEGRDKELLISLSKISGTIEEANADLKSLLNQRHQRQKAKERAQERYLKESEEISAICWKIWCEFDIKIPFLSQPSSVEDAKKLYRRLKREHRATQEDCNINY